MDGFTIAVIFAAFVGFGSYLGGKEKGAREIADGCRPEGTFIVNDVRYACKATHMLLDGKPIPITQ